jgi:hypothetical protein
LSASKLAQVLLGVLGVWLIASAAETLPYFAAYYWFPGPSPEPAEMAWLQIVWPAAQFAVSLGVGVFVFWKRAALARWIAGGDETPLPGVSGLQAAAFAVLGAVFVVEGLSDAIPALAASESAGSGFESVLWKGVVELALGLALFLGARGLASVWSTLRTAGSPGNGAG